MGKLIVIDGLDGCGKATQCKIISERLKAMGYKIKTISFPDYNSDSSALIKMYLNGEFGNKPEEINPYTASLFYSVDRAAQFIKEIQRYYDDNYVLLADRYISSNIIYQGSKFKNIDEQKEYFKWMYETETEKIGIPKDDLTLALYLPIETSQKLMEKRYNGDSSKKDLHESNLEFLEACAKTIDTACEYLNILGYNWHKIDCSDTNGEIKPMDEITNQLINRILAVL